MDAPAPPGVTSVVAQATLTAAIDEKLATTDWNPPVEEYHLLEEACGVWIGIAKSKTHHQCGEPTGHPGPHVCVAGDYTQAREKKRARAVRPGRKVEKQENVEKVENADEEEAA